MKITSHEQRLLVPRRTNVPVAGSLNAKAIINNVPLGTLKTRIRKLIDSGIERERAIEIALNRPIGPQGRPRKQD
ncbi:hypothetical protein BTW07_05515 [Salinicola socius]|uniref:Uncharacterized protein n=1 Tax=Salinicola socius TaxID=404433 RepID=A0A1Q8SUG4_9GAMM|nr:hypothetical protein BTW07_05515 [Salinicola socius]